MCMAGEKSKLVIVGTKEMKKKISVDGKEVTETKSEKLL